MLASAHTPQRSSPRDVERDIPLRFGDGAVETGIYTPTDAYGVNRAYVTLPVVYSPRPSLERSERRESWEGRPRTPPPSYGMSGRDRVHSEVVGEGSGGGGVALGAAGDERGGRREGEDATPRYSLFDGVRDANW